MHVPMRRRLGFSLMLVLACGDDGASTSEGTTGGDTTGTSTTMTTSPSTSDASTGSSTTEAMTESAEESTMGGSVSTSLGEEGSSSSSTSAIEPTTSDDTTTGEETTDTSGMTLVTDSTFGPGTESDTEPPLTSSESGVVTGGECAIGGTGGMGMGCEWGIYCENFTHEMVCDAVECVCYEDGVETNACPAMDVCDDGTVFEYAEVCCGIGS